MNVNIPPGGISMSDEIESTQVEKFRTEVVPVKDLSGVAQLVTTSLTSDSFEPVRYIVSLGPQLDEDRGTQHYCLVDIPPFSSQLAAKITDYIGKNGVLLLAVITSRDAIHYDDAPAVYSSRRPDLVNWLQAFPQLSIVGYRLDIPRDCRSSVSQVLDGYGPFALNETTDEKGNVTFIETGRPLKVEEWDPETRDKVLNGQQQEENAAGGEHFSLEAIRENEAGKRLLAVYTPGHSFGSISYVFPKTRVCCSGYTIPIEDVRGDDETTSSRGPALDCRGYISESRAGISRQMESAETLIDTYTDRFDVILPSRGDPLFLDELDIEKRKKELKQILAQYKRIGEVYKELGIIPRNE